MPKPLTTVTAFPRCDAHASSGARCWRSPGHEENHLVLAPGVTPTARALVVIANAHPEMDGDHRNTLMLLAALEPLGALDAFTAFTEALEAGGSLTPTPARGPRPLARGPVRCGEA